MSKSAPSPDHLAVMRRIVGGADVTGFTEARLLREVEKKWPDLIEITEAMGTYDVMQPRPYFGAILTAEGCKVCGVAVPALVGARRLVKAKRAARGGS